MFYILPFLAKTTFYLFFIFMCIPCIFIFYCLLLVPTNSYIYIYIYTHTRVCACACVCVRVCVNLLVQTINNTFYLTSGITVLIQKSRKSRISPDFMQTEGSVPCSQQLVTCSYYATDIFSPRIPTLFL